ncbi:MAG: glycosyltransferase family 39 protein [Pseudomonadota bacterium]
MSPQDAATHDERHESVDEGARTPSSAVVRDAAAVVAVKALTTAAVLAGGFTAISDDDYARVVTALRFADAPALDPTGTSWLPLPFWIYGGALAVFGSDLGVARACAFVLGVLAAGLVWAAARLLDLSRRAAVVGATLAAVFPYSAYLGAATVPEAPTAALTLFGAATVASDARMRLLGALALGAASAARYEPWAAAAAFAAITGWDALRSRDPRLVAATGLALAFPAAWLLHGIVRHGDALFFVERVASYRAALGPDDPWLERLIRTPRAFVTSEPELVLGTLGLFLVAPRGLLARERRALTKSGSVLVAIVLLAVLGDLLGGAPTHHGERALLAVWSWLALVAGALATRIGEIQLARRSLAAITLVATIAVGAGVIRRRWPRAPFTERIAEIDIGKRARARSIDRLAIDAPDFGYFAIQAAFGRPRDTRVLDARDPREPRSRDLLVESPPGLRRFLLTRGYRWLAVPTSRVERARQIGSVRELNDRWALIELAHAEAPRGLDPSP